MGQHQPLVDTTIGSKYNAVKEEVLDMEVVITGMTEVTVKWGYPTERDISVYSFASTIPVLLGSTG